ncbi:hypothetical protein ACIHDR_32255 [Nocardia sp. NPDC052278]|uniref:hypothetical protein n=1 Tax=unclassified Nocardia TaxID=2637762 RepID=UPI003685983D
MLRSSWPGAIALPLIAYAWTLVAIRAFTFRATAIERRATFVFAALTAAATVRERVVQDAVGRGICRTHCCSNSVWSWSRQPPVL